MAKRRPAPKRPRPRALPKKAPSTPSPFPVSAPRSSKLKGDKKIAQRMQEAFESIGIGETIRILKARGPAKRLTSELAVHLHYDGKAVKAGMTKSLRDLPIRQTISSPLALYRTLCLFPEAKLTAHPWNIFLRHITTGQILSIGDFKGGFDIQTTFAFPKDAPKPFLKDILRLLSALLHSRCPHPSGHVAGSLGA